MLSAIGSPIKGSEQIKTWVNVERGLWQIVLPDSYFGGFNPYKSNLSGGWLRFGSEYHLGEVHINEKSLWEKLSLDEVRSQPNTWYTEANNPTETVIYANFSPA